MLLSKLGKQTICMLMKYNTRKEVQVVTDISQPPQALGGCASWKLSNLELSSKLFVITNLPSYGT